MFFSRATPTQNNILGLSTAGRAINYQLVLSGTYPPDLGAQSTALRPEIVRLVGRSVEGINTVTDYTVTRVASCAGLPNTSTAPEAGRPWLPTGVGAVVLVLIAAGLAGRRLYFAARSPLTSPRRASLRHPSPRS
jgi:hypothetical protein